MKNYIEFLKESLWRSWIWIADPDGGESALPGGHAVGVVVSIGASESHRGNPGEALGNPGETLRKYRETMGKYHIMGKISRNCGKIDDFTKKNIGISCDIYIPGPSKVH